MSTFGINVFDGTGKVLINNERLLHRVWHQGMYSGTNQTVYYAQPLDHKPSIISYGVDNVASSCLVQHVTDANGNYVGFTLNFGTFGAGTTVVIAFARR
jgi:hypothetical protein